MTRMWTAVVVALLVGSGLLAAQGTRGADASRLEAAVNRELIDGDIRGAIEVYRALSKSSDRVVAASALLRLSVAQMRLKNEAEAVAALEAVVTGYEDQRETAAQARTRLAVMRKVGTAAPLNGVRSERPSYRHLFTFDLADGVWGNRVSFDGRFVPFTRWNEGALYLRDLETGADRQLTSKPLLEKIDAYAETAVASRNTSHVAYAWFEEGLGQQLRVVDVRQPGVPTPRVLYSNPDVDWIGPNDWSPDGSSLAVTIVRKDRSRARHACSSGGQPGAPCPAVACREPRPRPDWRRRGPHHRQRRDRRARHAHSGRLAAGWRDSP